MGGNIHRAFCVRLSPLTTELRIDFETRSTVDLKKTGVWPYAQHHHTDIWCMAWAFNNDEPQIWTPGMLLPSTVREFIHDDPIGEWRAWNAQFERVIWKYIMQQRYGFPAIDDRRWVCTAAEAAAMALPRSLGQCADVLKVGQNKDQEGYNLMMRMARPRAILSDGTPVWWDVPDRRRKLEDYCKQDVRTEGGLVTALRRLTPLEREVYLLDQRMNDRGIPIDVQLVLSAQKVVEEGTRRANEALSTLTGGQVTSITNHNRLREYLNENGIETDSVGKPAVAALLEGTTLSPRVREILQLRVDAGRSSNAKLESMLNVRSILDDRARGLLLYHGAGTGRWSGKLIQPQNFPRGEVKAIETLIDPVLENDYELLNCFHHPVVIVLSMLRSMMTAAPGHDLIAGDFSAIEARVLNWLAGQDNVVAMFAAMDAGDKTKHPYKQMAVAMGRAANASDVVKGSEDYQAGKAAELGCGYQMGDKKFISAAWDVYQVRVTEEQSKTAVTAYRSTHDKVVDFWWETIEAAITAVKKPGVPVYFGARKNLRAIRAGGYLYLVLPSGRPLCYAAPEIAQEYPPWCFEDVPIEGKEGQFKRVLKLGSEKRDTLMYWSNDQKYGWCKQRTYGGHLVENICQAVARDLMAESMLRLEKKGYLPLLSVHDEVISEIPEDFGTLDEFLHLLAETPAWAEGCPVASEGWRGFRYRK